MALSDSVRMDYLTRLRRTYKREVALRLADSPTPPQVESLLDIRIAYVPFPRLKVAYFLFETETDRLLFLRTYT